MLTDIHDSLLIGYSIHGENRELILSIKPNHHNATLKPFSVLFQGVAAHHFSTPLLPAILSDITRLSASDLIEMNWPAIEQGYHLAGWPGPWAETLSHAIDYAASHHLNGFQIESSYGLSGWVLAESVQRLNRRPD